MPEDIKQKKDVPYNLELFDRLQALLDKADSLSDWHLKFVTTLIDKYETFECLTLKQYSMIKTIEITYQK